MASGPAMLHQARIDLIGLQQIVAACGIGVMHRDPGIGDDAGGTRDRLLRRLGDGDLGALGLAHSSRPRIGREALGTSDRQFAAQPADRMNPGGGDIVAVADPGNGLFRRAARDALPAS